jgi:glycosyltransferase involved in cell wall biosynthesis
MPDVAIIDSGRSTPDLALARQQENPQRLAGTQAALPKSVILITYHFPPEIGGIHTRMLHYVQNLRSRGISVTVFFVISRGTTTKRYFISGAEVIVLPGQSRFFPGVAIRLLKTSISKHADVIHVVTGTSTMIGTFAIVMGRAMRLPSVISFFGKEQFEFATPVHRWLFKIAIVLATSIGVNTPYTAASIPRRFQRKVHVLLGGAEEWTYPPSSASQQDCAILFVGRLTKTKGVDDLLRALKLVLQKRPSTRLVVVGDGPERANLIEMAKSLGVDSHVEFTGTLIGRRLQDEYEKSAVVVLPSKYVEGEASSETLGLTLIEGAMHSKPLIGTSHGGIPEIVKDGQNGFLVPENNPQALADGLVRLITDEELRHAMGAEALRMARTKFTWDAATERLLQSYTK